MLACQSVGRVRVYLFIFNPPRPEITTQKLYELHHCLANDSSIFLASSYIFNKPISLILCITTWLWPTGKVLSSIRHLSPVVATWLLIDSAYSICLELPPCPILHYNKPKAASLLINGIPIIQRELPRHTPKYPSLYLGSSLPHIEFVFWVFHTHTQFVLIALTPPSSVISPMPVTVSPFLQVPSPVPVFLLCFASHWF